MSSVQLFEKKEVNPFSFIAQDLTEDQFNAMCDELSEWLWQYYNYSFPKQYVEEVLIGDGQMRHIVEAAAIFYRKGLKATTK